MWWGIIGHLALQQPEAKIMYWLIRRWKTLYNFNNFFKSGISHSSSFFSISIVYQYFPRKINLQHPYQLNVLPCYHTHINCDLFSM